MKGRSQQCRMPAPATATTAEDWVDGSWTVDCSCGVTFDDGEEMVSCDECGVWVHTRCARFIRGRDASFVCHNCKAASRRLRSADDQLVEESEVAQLLVDMPNQADNPPPLPRSYGGGGGGGGGGGQPPPRRRFWTEIPLEDRVHVQGIPGGDPALFGNLSSVFSCQLWRCAGYVPKKFSIRYKEFPCWDDDEEDRGNLEDEKTVEKEDGDNSAASRGANMLFSLSNDILPPYASVAKLDVFREKKGVKEDKVSFGSGGDLPTNSVKGTNKIRGQHSVKRKRDDTREGKEISCSKKRPRSDADNAMSDNKKRGSSLQHSTNSSEVPTIGNSRARDSGSTSVKTEHQKEEKLAYSNSASIQEEERKSDESKPLIDSKNGTGIKGNDKKETCITSENVVQTEKPEISPAGDAVTQGEGIDLAKNSDLDEVENASGYCLHQPKGQNDLIVELTKEPCHSVPSLDNLVPASDDPMNFDIKLPENHVLSDSQDAIPTHFKLDNSENKIAQQVDRSRDYLKFPGCPISDRKMNGLDAEPVCESSCQLSDVRKDFYDINLLPSHERECHEAKKESNFCFINMSEDEQQLNPGTPRAEELVADPSVEKDPLEQRKKCNSNCSDEHILESQGSKKVPSAVPNLEPDAAKVSSASYLPINSRSFVSVTSPGTALSSSFAKASILTKERDKVIIRTSPKKECSETTLCTEGTMRETSKEPEKCYSKGRLSSRSKSSHITKISDLPASKHVIPGVKEPIPSTLSRASTKEDAKIHLGCVDASGSSQPSATSVYGKAVSTKCQKNEKTYHSVPFPTSKSLHNSMPLHTSQSANAFTNLSDEELALLLHQELNSSPRVPRVPRMRQAGGMQSATTSSMSVFARRSSVSSEKDQNLVFRRKNKDDRWRRHSRNHHDSNDVSKRKHKVSSPDHQHRESSFRKKDMKNRSSDTSLLSKKNNSVTSAESTSSGPSSSEASGRSSFPLRSSPKVPKEDVSQTPRTLPGLIDEIMSKDRHTTYDELCNAIHLTNASKRRRKVESLPNNELENRTAKTRAKEFPKGKRKARKRRLELKERGIKESRNKQIENAASDEDQTAFSRSSHEGSEIFSSDDDNQDTGPDDAETEMSNSSSDESD